MGYTYNIEDMDPSDVELYMPKGSYLLYEFSPERGAELAVRVPNPPILRGDYPDDPMPGVFIAPVADTRKHVSAFLPRVMFWTPACGWYNLPGGAAYVERQLRRSAARTVLPQDLRITFFRNGGTLSETTDMRRLPSQYVTSVYHSTYPTSRRDVDTLLLDGTGAALNTTVAFLHGEEPEDGVIRVGQTYAGQWRVEEGRYVVSPATPFNKVILAAMSAIGLA